MDEKGKELEALEGAPLARVPPSERVIENARREIGYALREKRFAEERYLRACGTFYRLVTGAR